MQRVTTFPDPTPVALFPTTAVRLAALWVAAGALFKLFNGSPNDLPPAVQEFFLGPDLTFRLAISVELIFLTTALLRPKWGWPWIAALFVVFLYVLLRLVLSVMADKQVGFLEAAFAEGVSCGCFGSSIKTPPGFIIAVDALLLVLVLASRPWRSRLGAFGPSWLPTGLAALAVLAPWLVKAGAAEAEVEVDEAGKATVVGARYVEVRPESWVGQFIYDVEFASKFIPGLDTLPTDGTYVLYRPTCDHCAAHIQELAAQDDGSLPLVFVEVPEKDVTEENRAVRVFPQGGHVTHVTLPTGTEYVLTTPADFVLEGGIVTAAHEGIGREGE